MIVWDAIHYLDGIKTLHLFYWQMELFGLDHNSYRSYFSPQGQVWVVPWDDEKLAQIRQQQTEG